MHVGAHRGKIFIVNFHWKMQSRVCCIEWEKRKPTTFKNIKYPTMILVHLIFVCLNDNRESIFLKNGEKCLKSYSQILGMRHSQEKIRAESVKCFVDVLMIDFLVSNRCALCPEDSLCVENAFNRMDLVV